MFDSIEFICGYRMVTNKRNRKIPFMIELLNQKNGEAVIKLKDGKSLNFEERARYKFSVIAYDCGMPARESKK